VGRVRRWPRFDILLLRSFQAGRGIDQDPYARSIAAFGGWDWKSMTQQRTYIAVVDDDESIRESLPDLIRVFGHEAEAFSSAEEFLSSKRINQTKCMVLDIAMPGRSGIELQRELAHQGRKIPIVFITAHGDEQTCQRLRQGGAVECLLKPFTDTALLDALNAALQSRSPP
jgi:FixJ family two-component response regulator